MNHNRFLIEYLMMQQGALLDKVDSTNHSSNGNLDSRLCNFKSKYSFSCGTFCAKQTSGPEQSTNLNGKKAVLDASVAVLISGSFLCPSFIKSLFISI